MRVPLSHVRRIFEPCATIGLDWPRVQGAEMIVHEALKERKAWKLVWHVDEKAEAHWGDGRQLDLETVVKDFLKLGLARQDKILAIARSYKGEKRPSVLPVLTYRIEKGRRIVLDGCHRLVALAWSGAPFRIVEYQLRGPLKSHVLKDLWEHEEKR